MILFVLLLIAVAYYYNRPRPPPPVPPPPPCPGSKVVPTHEEAVERAVALARHYLAR